MANTKQAKKRAAQNVRRRARNRSVLTQVRHKVRDIRQAAATGADKAAGMLTDIVSELDRAVRKGVLHRNTAARLKSRVTKGTAKAAKK
ncbi:MAG TPA: 30S ribosomal protein S20 [Thermoanaerobaculia bacterium]|jgi:small subunit ribosomal protein S20|nr:30S ribosomal protein S20 [Thermoanaerobaculia bacterium]HQR67879.1 30S ribosomal protein S20 [Thermoanaerobaculia bacterium]